VYRSTDTHLPKGIVVKDCVNRIRNYLASGGLFNPELMEHEKVRDLLVDCRDEITALEKKLAEQLKNHEVKIGVAAKTVSRMEEKLKVVELNLLAQSLSSESLLKRLQVAVECLTTLSDCVGDAENELISEALQKIK
jgi:heterodisulfide reductase subunit C